MRMDCVECDVWKEPECKDTVCAFFYVRDED